MLQCAQSAGFIEEFAPLRIPGPPGLTCFPPVDVVISAQEDDAVQRADHGGEGAEARTHVAVGGRLAESAVDLEPRFHPAGMEIIRALFDQHRSVPYPPSDST